MLTLDNPHPEIPLRRRGRAGADKGRGRRLKARQRRGAADLAAHGRRVGAAAAVCVAACRGQALEPRFKPSRTEAAHANGLQLCDSHALDFR